jgi:hypothetical protein
MGRTEEVRSQARAEAMRSQAAAATVILQLPSSDAEADATRAGARLPSKTTVAHTLSLEVSMLDMPSSILACICFCQIH